MESVDLVLASGSPRRAHLLAALGLEFEVAAMEIDERPSVGEAPAEHACRLAREKAEAARARLPAGRLVLAADTVVALEQDILGKPADPEDAARMLRRLSGRRHQVFTAVAAVRDQARALRLSSSEVEFRELPEREIQAYVATGEPLDKAGAYGIQGLGGIFVSRLCGSYSGVVGLPVCETADLLREFGMEILPPRRRGMS
jgi:septum formation protein